MKSYKVLTYKEYVYILFERLIFIGINFFMYPSLYLWWNSFKFNSWQYNLILAVQAILFVIYFVDILLVVSGLVYVRYKGELIDSNSNT